VVESGERFLDPPMAGKLRKPTPSRERGREEKRRLAALLPEGADGQAE